MSKDLKQLLNAAADALNARRLCRGHMALGLAKPPKPGSKPKLGEVYPWDVAKLHEVAEVSLLGAIALAAEATPDTEEVQQAYMAVHRKLRDAGVPYTPETWNDQESRTKVEVVDILRTTADGF